MFAEWILPSVPFIHQTIHSTHNSLQSQFKLFNTLNKTEEMCLLFLKTLYSSDWLFIFGFVLKGRVTEGRKREIFHLAGSFPRCLQQLGFGQTKPRGPNSIGVSDMGGQQCLNHHLLPSRVHFMWKLYLKQRQDSNPDYLFWNVGIPHSSLTLWVYIPIPFSFVFNQIFRTAL